MSGENTTQDPGLAVVEAVRKRMAIDAQWSIDRPRGLKWWGWNSAQEIWADAPFDDDGMQVVRVHARSDMLQGFDGTDKHMALLKMLGMTVTMSGLVRHPDDSSRIQLASSMYVHADNQGWAEDLFGNAVAIQAAEASILANQMPPGFGLEADSSAHPQSGPREEMDEMLDIIATAVNPIGQEPSRWEGDEMEGAVEMFQKPPCVMATGDESGLSAEFPYPAASGTSLLQLQTGERNPRVGNGLLSLLHTPESGELVDLMRSALELNERELRELTRCHFFGSWTASDMGLTYVSFFPNIAFRPGLLQNLCMSALLRARWISEDVHDYDWNDNFEACFQAKMEHLQQLVGGGKKKGGLLRRLFGKDD